MEIKVEDLLREIAELKLQLSKALARIEELEKENKKLKTENAMLLELFIPSLALSIAFSVFNFLFSFSSSSILAKGLDNWSLNSASSRNKSSALISIKVHPLFSNFT